MNSLTDTQSLESSTVHFALRAHLSLATFQVLGDYMWPTGQHRPKKTLTHYLQFGFVIVFTVKII